MTEPTAARSAFDERWRTLGYHERPDAPRSTINRDAAEAFAATLAPPPQSGALPTLGLAQGSAESTADFVIIKRLGEGGMGAVDLAEQRSLGREVAIKRLREALASDAEHVRALLQEARVMGRLDHPGIVPVHALGVGADGAPALVMKRVDGVSWAAVIDDPEHPHWRSLLSAGQERIDAHLAIASQLCNALRFAHARGVIHRDIKPENVMLGAFGEVYLLDWGVALDRGALDDETRTRIQVVGTPNFMAPEQFGAPIDAHDPRTDVYLLGATLHCALTGRPRHEGATLHAVMLSAFLSEPVQYPPSVPEELATLCNESTAQSPSQRPQSVDELQRRIAEYALHKGSIALARSSLDALERALSLGADAASSLEARKLTSQAHFGFVQALREWSANPLAREGLERCLLASIERELAARNPDGASALLAELAAPPPSLAPRLDALRAALRDEQLRAERARQHESEMDRSVSAYARAGLAAFGLLALGVISFVDAPSDARDVRAVLATIVRLDLALLGFFTAAVFFGRRRLLQNTISRQLTLTLGVLLAGGLASDTLSWAQRTPLESTATHKFIVGAFVLAASSLAIERALLVSASISLIAAFVMARWPTTLELVGNGATVLVVLSLAWLALRQAPAQRASSP